MLDPFILRALLAAIGVALIAGVMGCFVVWRRMAYFGDSLAHSALLGVALGLISGLGSNIGILIICILFASLLLFLQQRKLLATDTLLGILAHAGLSVAVVVISLANIRINLQGYLFGDILTVTFAELAWIYGGGAFVLCLLIWRWSGLVLMTINEDLARAERINVFFNHLLLLILMSVVVAISIRITGILLMTSMLIIPAATARQFADTPVMMAIMAAGFGIIAVFIGLYGSLWLDTPSGPSIVASAALIFLLLMPIKLLLSAVRQK